MSFFPLALALTLARAQIIIRQFVPDEVFWMTGDQLQYLGDDVSYAVWPGELDDVVVADDSDSDASSTDEVEDLLTAGDVREINGLTVTAVYTDKTGRRSEPTEYIPGGMLTIAVHSQDVFLSEAFLDVLAVNTQFDMYAPRSGQRLGSFAINHPTPWEMDRAIIDPLGWRKPRRPDDMIPAGLAEVDSAQAVVFRNSFETRPREPVEGVEMEEGETEVVAQHPSKFEIVWFCPAPELGPARISLNFRFHRSSVWQTITLTLRESPKRIRTGADNKAEAVLQFNFDQEARHRDFFRFVSTKNWDAVEPFLDKKCVLFKEKALKKRRWRCMDALEDIFDHHRGIVVPSPVIFKGGLTKSVVLMEQCPLWTIRAEASDDEEEDEDEGDDDDDDEEGEEEGEGLKGEGAEGEGGGDEDNANSEEALTDAESLSLSLAGPEPSALADTDADPLLSALDDRPASSQPSSREGSERGSERDDRLDARDGHAGGSAEGSRASVSGSEGSRSGDSSPAASPRSSLPGSKAATPQASPRGDRASAIEASAGENKADRDHDRDHEDRPGQLTPRPEGGRAVRFASEVQIEVFAPDDGSPGSSPHPTATDAAHSSSSSSSSGASHDKHHAHAGALGPAGTVGPMGIFDADDGHDEEDHARLKAGHLRLPEFMFTSPVVGKPFQREVLRLAKKETNNVLVMKVGLGIFFPLPFPPTIYFFRSRSASINFFSLQKFQNSSSGPLSLPAPVQTTKVACVKEMRLYSTDPQRQTALAAIPAAPAWIRSSFLRPQPAAPEIKRPHKGYYDLKVGGSFIFFSPSIFFRPLRIFPLNFFYPRQKCKILKIPPPFLLPPSLRPTRFSRRTSSAPTFKNSPSPCRSTSPNGPAWPATPSACSSASTKRRGAKWTPTPSSSPLRCTRTATRTATAAAWAARCASSGAA